MVKFAFLIRRFSPSMKASRLSRLFRNTKGGFCLRDLVLVQDGDVVAEMGELECLHLRGDHVGVADLLEDAEIQHEHGVIPVDGGEGVVAAFVDVDHIVAVGHEAAAINFAVSPTSSAA